MNRKADIIAVSSDVSAPIGPDVSDYPQGKSRWFGSVTRERLRLVFSFYSPDGNEIAMPIASMASYIKKEFPWVDVILDPVLILRDAVAYSPKNYAKRIQALDPDVFAISVMSPHWYPLEPYFEELKVLMPKTPIVIGGYQAMLSQEQTISNPNVDYICVGDGEYAIGNVLNHLK